MSDDGGDLRETAQQLGRLEPVLAQEWYDQKLRALLEEVRVREHVCAPGGRERSGRPGWRVLL